MQICKGCREQQIPGDGLCLQCIEDLNCWLREIPDLYAELNVVRLPGSIPSTGPRTSAPSRIASPSPVRLEVLDLLDRGETLRRLFEWTDDRGSVREICDSFRHHLLNIAGEDWAGNFWRAMRSLCRELGRTVGQPEERPVGKCSEPECRGQLMRLDTGGVYCRRCGDKPDMQVQPVWVTLRQASLAVGRPIETIRTWYKRGKLVPSPRAVSHVVQLFTEWSEQIGPAPLGHAWLPAVARLATEPQAPAIVNHGSRAEPSVQSPQEATAAPSIRSKTFGCAAGVHGDADPAFHLRAGSNP